MKKRADRPQRWRACSGLCGGDGAREERQNIEKEKKSLQREDKYEWEVSYLISPCAQRCQDGKVCGL